METNLPGILIVDDNEDNRYTLQLMLENDGLARAARRRAGPATRSCEAPRPHKGRPDHRVLMRAFRTAPAMSSRPKGSADEHGPHPE